MAPLLLINDHKPTIIETNNRHPLVSPITSYSILSLADIETSEESYSTSSEETSGSFFSDDTLSMISTPWSTESWTSVSPCTTQTVLTSLSLHPKSSSSSDISDISSDSRIIKTILNTHSFSDKSLKILPLMDYESLSSTLSSWSLETFTSPIDYSHALLVKISYPWSPSSYLSETDNDYPSSVYTSVATKVCRKQSLAVDSL